jgi:hypothetical protein
VCKRAGVVGDVAAPFSSDFGRAAALFRRRFYFWPI